MPLSLDVAKEMPVEPPPFWNRPVWTAATIVDPFENESGSTWVACCESVVVNGSALICIGVSGAAFGAMFHNLLTALLPPMVALFMSCVSSVFPDGPPPKLVSCAELVPPTMNQFWLLSALAQAARLGGNVAERHVPLATF